jgi:hypothetical protein
MMRITSRVVLWQTVKRTSVDSLLKVKPICLENFGKRPGGNSRVV